MYRVAKFSFIEIISAVQSGLNNSTIQQYAYISYTYNITSVYSNSRILRNQDTVIQFVKVLLTHLYDLFSRASHNLFTAAAKGLNLLFCWGFVQNKHRNRQSFQASRPTIWFHLSCYQNERERSCTYLDSIIPLLFKMRKPSFCHLFVNIIWCNWGGGGYSHIQLKTSNRYSFLMCFLVPSQFNSV